jgi:anaerobic ribonucleoside-triphosphate reductase activating protein
MPLLNETTTKLRLNRIAIPIASLGYGRRAAIWVQGCSLACRGCISRQTWNPKGGEDISVSDLVELIQLTEEQYGHLDGLTISGGEPMEQADAVFTLVDSLRRRNWLGTKRDVLVYSGLTRPVLLQRFGEQLSLFDVMIAGPFEQGNPGVGIIGSGNQVVLPLTALGADRYDKQPQVPVRMEGAFDGKQLTLSGVPKQGEMEYFSRLLEENGLLKSRIPSNPIN